MKTIYKYLLPIQDVIELVMPLHTSLSVQVQSDIPSLWAMVDLRHEARLVRFRMYGTGHVIDPELNLQFVGTFQLPELGLVYHVFEEVTG